MIAWLQSVLPQLNLTNFTSDWNNGITLAALIDYCSPGLYPDWRSMNPQEGYNENGSDYLDEI